MKQRHVIDSREGCRTAPTHEPVASMYATILRRTQVRPTRPLLAAIAVRAQLESLPASLELYSSDKLHALALIFQNLG